jgi:hypothetical protein
MVWYQTTGRRHQVVSCPQSVMRRHQEVPVLPLARAPWCRVSVRRSGRVTDQVSDSEQVSVRTQVQDDLAQDL